MTALKVLKRVAGSDRWTETPIFGRMLSSGRGLAFEGNVEAPSGGAEFEFRTALAKRGDVIEYAGEHFRQFYKIEAADPIPPHGDVARFSTIQQNGPFPLAIEPVIDGIAPTMDGEGVTI